MKRIAFVSAVFALGLAGTAHAQAPVVPAHDWHWIDAGSNPVIGDTQNGPGIAYIDGSGANLIYEPYGSTYTPTVTGSSCAFKGNLLFCEGSGVLPFPPYIPYGYLMSEDMYSSQTETLSTIVQLSDASQGFAVWTQPNEIRWSDTTGTGTLSNNLYTTTTSTGPTSPATNDKAIVHQTQAGGLWTIHVGVIGTGVTDSFTLGTNEPRPDIKDDYVVHEDDLGRIVTRPTWVLADHVGLPIDPSLTRCARYHDPKLGVVGYMGAPSMLVVRGESCPEGRNVLYVINQHFGADYPPGSLKAYFVGELSSTSDFSVYGDQVTFVDAAGKIEWVHVDVSAL